MAPPIFPALWPGPTCTKGGKEPLSLSQGGRGSSISVPFPSQEQPLREPQYISQQLRGTRSTALFPTHHTQSSVGLLWLVSPRAVGLCVNNPLRHMGNSHLLSRHHCRDYVPVIFSSFFYFLVSKHMAAGAGALGKGISLTMHQQSLINFSMGAGGCP